MNIPKGYQLNVTSWTNDADEYNTTTHNGLTADDVVFLLKVLKPFESDYDGGLFGNNTDCSEAVDEHIWACWEEHPTKASSTCSQYMVNGIDGVADLAYDLVGRNEYFGWRVFESAKVFYFENEVQDVTSKFN